MLVITPNPLIKQMIPVQFIGSCPVASKIYQPLIAPANKLKPNDVKNNIVPHLITQATCLSARSIISSPEGRMQRLPSYPSCNHT